MSAIIDGTNGVTAPLAVVIAGATSGQATISPPAVAGTPTLTLPTTSDTLVGRATTDTLTNKTIDGASNTLTVAGISKSYTSTGQTISTAGLLTLAHGMAVTPKLVSSYVKCTTGGGEAGYAQNDEVMLIDTAFSSGQGAGVKVDATNITIRMSNNANVFAVHHATTGVITNLTNGSWQLYVRAWG